MDTLPIIATASIISFAFYFKHTTRVTPQRRKSLQARSFSLFCVLCVFFFVFAYVMNDKDLQSGGAASLSPLDEAMAYVDISEPLF